MDERGNVLGYGSATDAEQDIAAALIMAWHRQLNGEWVDFRNGFYSTRARVMLDCIWETMFTEDGVVLPGGEWGSPEIYNPSYFSPAWYRLFQNFDDNKSHDWNNIIVVNYEIIKNSPGYNIGLVPDWMTSSGHFVQQGVLSSTYRNGEAFYKDAIRVFWRLGIDYYHNLSNQSLWFLTNSLNFVKSQGGVQA
ncbi:MAG: hypothetical protein EBV19_05760, partial [Flavobacteriia bacterium]|nr:hypothetical protein [Flavobacteriia bacterium]